jgi:sigma-B regulation protein RsbU (phosphoserine phosphatase)
MSEVEDETKGLDLGAIDYITKPISPAIVKARIKNHLELKEAREHLKNQNEILELRVEERTKEVLDLQRVEFELRASKEKVENELNIAAQIQKSILPSDFPAFPEHGEFDLYAMMIPAREVGGDFYDFFFVDDDHLAVIIADVSDKGVPAALFMMISRTIFRSIAKQRKSPSQVLTETNDLLCEGNETGMFVTAFLAYYHLFTGRLTYSNGGHNPALLFGPNNVCRKLTCKHGTALGVRPGQSYKEYVDKLETGQILVLYTDGVTEACSPHDELFGVDRFTKLVCDCHALSLSQMFNHIDRDLKAFQQGNQFDDITMLALKREI